MRIESKTLDPAIRSGSVFGDQQATSTVSTGAHWFVTILDAIGFLAAGLVFLTFSMKSLLSLRLVAIASNMAFVLYAYAADLMPILVLHMLLLPLNIYRTWEQVRLMRRIELTLSSPPRIDVLLPHMTSRDVDIGAVLFRKGDPADCLYYIDSGVVEIPEFGKQIVPGGFFGEIGLFSKNRSRTASAVMREAGTICTIDRHPVSHQP